MSVQETIRMTNRSRLSLELPTRTVNDVTARRACQALDEDWRKYYSGKLDWEVTLRYEGRKITSIEGSKPFGTEPLLISVFLRELMLLKKLEVVVESDPE
jgi:hypothetical protein